jgi:hypothetical protein
MLNGQIRRFWAQPGRRSSDYEGLGSRQVLVLR